MVSSSSTTNPLLGVQVTEKLTRQNHAMWSAQVLATLRGARLERYVNGKAVAPSEEVNEKTADGKVVTVVNPALRGVICRGSASPRLSPRFPI